MCLDGTAVQQPEPTFLNENGPIKPDRSQHCINRLLKRQGLPYIHDWRLRKILRDISF